MNFGEWFESKVKEKNEKRMVDFLDTYAVTPIKKELTLRAIKREDTKMVWDVIAVSLMYLFLGMLIGVMMFVSFAANGFRF